MGFDYSEQLDSLDASVFSGELLITHLNEFKHLLERWGRAVAEQESHTTGGRNDTIYIELQDMIEGVSGGVADIIRPYSEIGVQYNSDPHQKEPSLTEMARFVVEKTGGCWHTGSVHRDPLKLIRTFGCSKCGSGDRNPAYTDDAGKVDLLRVMMRRGDWCDFAKLFPAVVYTVPPNWTTQPYIFFINSEYLTDTTGKLLRAAYWFFKERKGK